MSHYGQCVDADNDAFEAQQKHKRLVALDEYNQRTQIIEQIKL